MLVSYTMMKSVTFWIERLPTRGSKPRVEKEWHVPVQKSIHYWG